MRALDLLPYAVAAWLFCCGLYGVVTSRHLVHAVMCLAVLQSSTYVLLLAIGFRMGVRRLYLPTEFRQRSGS